MSAQIVDASSTRSSEGERVLRWRIAQLHRAGYPARAARILGSRCEVDLHRALDLVARGCSPALAVRILL